MGIDPITLEVVRNALQSIADEMTGALVRTAYSTNIKDRRDCSCGIYTPQGEVVAQTELGTPLHMGSMPDVVKAVLRRFPSEQLGPGDAVAMNTPFPTGPGHLNDVAVVSPVYADGQVVAMVANQAHHVDVGGYAPGSMPFGVTEIYQEGLQIPPVKIIKNRAVDEELMAIIVQNVRTKTEGRGDLLAQVAANNVGIKRLQELAHKYGASTLGLYLKEILDYAERRMLAGIGRMPRGTFRFEDYIEGDSITEDPIRIQVAVEIGEGSVRVDFTGSSPQVRGPLNTRSPQVAACVYFALKCIVDPELPVNAGTHRPIHVVVPEGSLLQATFPAAVCNANIITSQRIVDVLLGALAQAVPERVVAACSGTMNLLNIGGIHPANGQYYNHAETYAGGQGASHRQDGMDGVHNHMTNTRNAPIEVIESTYPLMVRCYGLVPDSEGPGQYRGGTGVMRHFVILGRDVKLTVSSDRAKIAPWGLFGGGHASPSRCVRITAQGETIPLGSKVTTSLDQGDQLITVTPGGGGWGSPKDRDPKKVAWDVREGLVSPQRAREVYGVEVQ